MTSMGKKREVLNHWQRVCKLILAKEDVLTLSRALELALFYETWAKPQHNAAATIRLIAITPKYPNFCRAGECCRISVTI
jgi:hypothetical protein